MSKRMSTRRNFLEKLAFTTAATTLTIPTAFAASKKASAKDEENIEFEFKTAPYLQNLTPTSVSIVFITSKKSSSWVVYGEETPNKAVFTEDDGMRDAYQTLFNIEINDLKPGTTYYYRIVSKEILSFKPYKLDYGKEISSTIHQFRTPELTSNEVSCLILNDIHDRPHSFKDLINLNNQEAYDFVFLNGDVFDYQVDEQQLIDHLIKPCTDLFASEIPFILSRGNHETRGKFCREIKPYFTYPNNKYYNTFKQGPVLWIVLDTGEDKEDDAEVYANIVNFDEYREQQAKWLEDIMNAEEYNNALYKVVLMHIPPFHSGDWHGTLHCRELFAPLFEKYNVDIVLSGHTHRYGVHEPQSDHSYPIIIGGGPKEGTRTLIRLDANEKHLTVVMKDDEGEIVGDYKINKT